MTHPDCDYDDESQQHLPYCKRQPISFEEWVEDNLDELEHTFFFFAPIH